MHERHRKEFLIALRVKKGSRAAGKDVSANGLDGINGLYIVAVDQFSSSQRFQAVSGNFVLQVHTLNVVLLLRPTLYVPLVMSREQGWCSAGLKMIWPCYVGLQLAQLGFFCFGIPYPCRDWFFVKWMVPLSG